MKYNDDSLMLFDFESGIDYGAFDTIDNSLNYSSSYVDFTCNDLDQFPNPIKSYSFVDELEDIFAPNDQPNFTANFEDFTDSLFNSNSFSSFNNDNSSASNFNNPFNVTDKIENNLIEPNNQNKREVKKKLVDLTQRKLSTLCFDNKLRNQVLLKSALKSANSINEDNLLGTKSKLDKVDTKTVKQDLKIEKPSREQDDKEMDKICSSPRKRNFKNNSFSLLNEKDVFEEKKNTKKQKLCHLDDVELNKFLDENSFNYNDELTLNNLANSFIKLKTQHA